MTQTSRRSSGDSWLRTKLRWLYDTRKKLEGPPVLLRPGARVCIQGGSGWETNDVVMSRRRMIMHVLNYCKEFGVHVGDRACFLLCTLFSWRSAASASRPAGLEGPLPCHDDERGRA